MKTTLYLLAALALGLCSCSSPGPQVEPDPWAKVELDLTALDEAGLRGQPDGKVAVAYEFAIPDTATHRAQVAAIDPTIQFMAGSRGRIGAGEGQCLCVGSTHQDSYREVLRRLAALAYVERIVECHFE